ncbi:uncharacterized protein LOC111390905 [Olea europaea var. sylvestris]|uniref:uncharacterized protein LOC111390905 n=1 Tax=Olea europaea var. sylvestris TaxID=158386 RepID=UPI000C1D1C52|nr:uncharacterized protein LOC111390905 [Olea europaea var. sylvestris]
MATELQHTINLSTRASSEHFFAYRLRLKNHSKSDFCKLRCSMDRLQQKLPNIQSMKNTMLMHEEIFNQQVRELHRLYNLQKKIMHELNNKITRKAGVKETDINHHAYNLRDDQRELSGSCSGESSRLPLKFDLKKPAEEGTPSSTQVKKETKSVDEEADVETDLTLSIGHCPKEKRPKKQCSPQLGDRKQSSRSTKTGKGEEYGEPGSSMSSTSGTPNQANKRPHWLLQDLSLNRT